jgi:2-polyprenyl-3-methyl-5-hydroxy-6-metoxy-1,4-benzoquinol methylase
MKLCLQCENEFDANGWLCPACGFEPRKLNGIPLLAPDLDDTPEGFMPEAFKRLHALEEKNFWFRSRNRLITWAIETYFPQAKNILEVGCGTGFVITEIESRYPGLECTGSELHSVGLSFAKTRIKRTKLMQMDARKIPFREEFDIIGAFDVLEHIKQDSDVLAQLFNAIRPGGGIVLTVPQHPSLWSSTDETACHERRYTSRELVEKVSAAGFKITRKSSFVSFLLPFMALSRWKERVFRSQPNSGAELQVPNAMNSLFEKVLNLEVAVIRSGVGFPAGGSLFLVAHKP